MQDRETVSLIRPHTLVGCSMGGEIASVDHVEGRRVTAVDDQVHLDRPGSQAMREWTTTPPKQ